MESVVRVAIHSSQFPAQVHRDLLESLRTRRVNHKFHYDSFKQTQRWLALHQAYSPSRNDPDCAAIYDRSFAAVAQRLDGRPVQIVGLGCGGGQKDTRLLACLRQAGSPVAYTPVDVSTAMVLVAQQTATQLLGPQPCVPLVCDLATASDLAAVLQELRSSSAEQGSGVPTRLVTFFGMIPNFEPSQILPRLSQLLRPGDELLLSANLAPGPDFSAGMQRILPLYDNALTRQWLLTFLVDLGIEPQDGSVRFVIEEGPSEPELKRVIAYFSFQTGRSISVQGESFEFHAGEVIQLFFSYRYTPGLVRTFLGRYGLEVRDQWVTASGEEGVFLVSRTGEARGSE